MLCKHFELGSLSPKYVVCEKKFKSPDGRSLAAARRKLAKTQGTKVMLELLKEAGKVGHKADFVLFDSWYSSPAQLLDVIVNDKNYFLCSVRQTGCFDQTFMPVMSSKPLCSFL